MMKSSLLVCIILVMGFSPEASEAKADWTQWRGPNRNGATPDKTPLLDSWPKGGPKLLWKSEKLPGIPMSRDRPVGACGSVTVAGGKAYVFGHFFYNAGETVKLTTEMLKGWGWEEGVPEDLVKKVEEALNKRERRYGDELKKYAEEFVTSLEPSTAKKYGDYIRTRIIRGNPKSTWAILEKMAKVRDKEFKSAREVAKAAGISIHPHSHTKFIVDPVNATAQRITDGLVCYDAKTGKKLWITEFPGKHGSYYHFGASCSPAVAGGKCYFTGSAGTYCVDAETGEEVWKVKTAYTWSSPLVLHGLVYVNYPDGPKAFDAMSGKLVWHQEKLGDAYTSFAPWSVNGRHCVLAGANPRPSRHRWYGMWCLDAKSGEVIWNHSTVFHYSTPAIDGNYAVTFNKGQMTGYHLSSKAEKVLWTSKVGYDERGASAAVLNGYAYAVGGGYRSSGAHCYDLKTGELKWTEQYKEKGWKSESMSAIIADGKVFAYRGSKSREVRTQLTMFRASPEKYELLGVLDEGDLEKGEAFNMRSAPAIVGGKLYLRFNDKIACYDLRK